MVYLVLRKRLVLVTYKLFTCDLTGGFFIVPWTISNMCYHKEKHQLMTNDGRGAD